MNCFSRPWPPQPSITIAMRSSTLVSLLYAPTTFVAPVSLSTPLSRLLAASLDADVELLLMLTSISCEGYFQLQTQDASVAEQKLDGSLLGGLNRYLEAPAGFDAERFLQGGP